MKPRQNESRAYYYFWSIATIAVVTGQIYVGNGFRKMSESADGISADINLLIETMIFGEVNKITGGDGRMPIID